MYPGQEVVCVDAKHAEDYLIQNKVYKILATEQSFCSCPGYIVDVGIRDDSHNITVFCPDCGGKKPTGNVVLFHSSRFAPVDSLSDNITNYQETVNAQPFTITPLPAHV